MDEIDWIKMTKKAFVLFAKIFIGFGIFFAIFTLLTDSGRGWDYTKIMLYISLIMGVGLPAVLGVCYLILIIFSKIINSGRTVANFDKNYIRDLPTHCSPAISSLIYDLKINVYKDYTATVLYLCIKKYINLVKNGDTYKLELTEQQDYSNLERCEKYVLDVIKNKIEFDEQKFKEEIIKEAQEKELITDKKYSKTTKMLIILVFIIVFSAVAYIINKWAFIIVVSILGAVIYAGTAFVEYIEDTNTEYIRTENGKNMALQLKGLKRYIKEYTLIKDKEIDYIQILENYIPYALALDEAEAIEEFVKYNEEYRDFIYGRENIK